jgi:hypothetical protein
MTLQAVLFIVGFLAILLAYIFFIAFLARRLRGKIPHRVHATVEMIIIAGILLGVVGIFQPWLQAGYTYGFTLLLYSTLSFIVWSHIPPQPAPHKSAAVTETERRR